MAFCKHCGVDLNGANFCANCGSSADGNITTQQTPPIITDSRQQTLIEMNRMKDYFGSKADLYRAYDTVDAEVKERSERTFLGWIGTAILCVIIGLFSKAIFFYIAAVPFVVGYVLKRKNNKKKLAEITAKCEELGKEKDKLYADYGYCPIGQQYTHPDVLPLLYDYVSGGRANTTSEAINCLVADLKAEEQQETLRNIEKRTEDAAKAAKANRNIAIANFLFKK